MKSRAIVVPFYSAKPEVQYFRQIRSEFAIFSSGFSRDRGGKFIRRENSEVKKSPFCKVVTVFRTSIAHRDVGSYRTLLMCERLPERFLRAAMREIVGADKKNAATLEQNGC
jgi:hypothetical protein